MKKLLLALLVIPTITYSQTKTSITNGDFYNPLTWDCVCFPASGDNVVVNHDLTMNTSIYYTAGSITINASGSLNDNGNDMDIWVDGSGRFINHGDVSVRHIATSQWTYMDNKGSFTGIDSMLTQGVMNNSGSIEVYDFLNDQTGNFGNFGTMDIQNNMNNQGNFDNWNNLNVGLDFSNCNTQSMNAEFTNNGTVCISRDFLNCSGDALRGSWHYYVGNQGSNLGVFAETFTFHIPNGNFFNLGTVESGVTITTGACALQILENETISFELYPNPANELIHVSESSGDFTISDMKGQVVLQGILNKSEIDISTLNAGMYLFKIKDLGVIRFQKN